MAPDGLGSDDIEVDGDMSRPSGPMPFKRKCSSVFAPIVFLYEKVFGKKFWEMVLRVLRALISLTYFQNTSKHFQTLPNTSKHSKHSKHFYASKSARATLCTAKNKNPQKNL